MLAPEWWRGRLCVGRVLDRVLIVEEDNSVVVSYGAALARCRVRTIQSRVFLHHVIVHSFFSQMGDMCLLVLKDWL